MSERRLSILQLINGYHVGGDNTLACGIAVRLPESRFERHVCAMFDDNDPATGRRFESELTQAGVGVHRLEKTRYRKSWRVLLRLRRLVRQLGIDIIHSHGTSPDLHAAIALAGPGSPILIRTLHSTDFDFHVGHKTMERLLRHRFSRSVAVSEGVRDWALAFGLSARPLQVIQNGIDIAAFSLPAATRASLGPSLPDSCPLLISVGRMEADRVKGHEYLLEAMAMVVAGGREAHLLLVGDGALRPEYETRCREPDLAGRVTFLGRRHDVPALLKASQLFVAASVREGLSLAICEAGAAGLPVVATAIPGNRVVIQDGVDGELVAPRSPEALAQAIEGLLADPTRAERLAMALTQKVRTHFSLERVARDYADLYSSLADGRRKEQA